MVKKALQVTLALAFLLAWFGVLLPYMVSSENDFLVAGGLLVTMFAVVLAVLSVVREFLQNGDL